jgi:putative tryptophan/tyrosine transport system substrate-binding protein
LGLRIQPLPVRNVAEFDSAFSAMVRDGAGAALVLSTPLYMGGAKRLAELGIMHRVPTIGPREHVDAGGLLSYSPDRADLYRRAAGYADRILKGAKPAEMPVEQAIIWERFASA